MGESRSSVTGLQHKHFIIHRVPGHPHPDIIHPYALGKTLELWEEEKVKIGQEGCQQRIAFPLVKIITL